MTLAPTTSMAISATLHCLTGCAIGEVAGMIIGTALNFSTTATIMLAVSLAFIFGYSLSILPLRRRMPLRRALKLVLAADTLSIATMEIVDNLVMASIPGAMGEGLDNLIFWLALLLSLAAAFIVALPVNLFLLKRGQGHALMHHHHH